MKEEVREKIIELAKEGLNDEQIADVVFYSPMYVKQIRLEAGVARPKAGHKRFSEELIKQRLTEGKYPIDIAEEAGCSIDLVYLYKREIEREENG